MSKDVDESKYTRVTTVLSHYSKYGAVGVDLLEYACDLGERVHRYCELFANRMLFGEVDDDCLGYVDAFIDWFDANVEEVIKTEERLYCDTLMLQGQIDLLARVKGHEGIVCLDIKTTLAKSKSWNLQTAAYRWLCQVNGIEIVDRLVLQLKKENAFKVHVFPDETFLDEMNIFRGILVGHRYLS